MCTREINRQEELQALVKRGKIPHVAELEKHPEKSLDGRMWLMGQVAGSIQVRHTSAVIWLLPYV